MFKRLLNVAFIFAGIGSGLIGDYPSITPSNSKLLPPAFAFSIWSIIYLTGIFLAYKLIRNQISVTGPGITLISIGYFLSGFWIRFDGHPNIVSVLAISNLVLTIVAIYILRKTQISKTLLNFLSAFSSWLAIAASLVIADALKISTASNISTAIYLALALSITFTIYLFLIPLYGYLGTISWASFSILFAKDSSGLPIFIVAGVAFLISLLLFLQKIRDQKLTKSGL